jgi:hypothetical protein
MPAAAQAKAGATAQASSSLPATQPTTELPLKPAQQEPKQAQVGYANGLLSVSADNSSLNQILREISRETGMKITGGVTDERVFGQYGPATPSQVLATLLDGTGSNMLLLHRDGDIPAELVLTPRTGGPSPPNPNAAMLDEHPEHEEPRETVGSRPPRVPGGPHQNSPGAASSPNGAASSDASQPDSPNGAKSPQQIYEQLQRLRTQQQAAPE